MWQAKLEAEIIVAKIKSTACRFDTSPLALQQLKGAGLPDAVLLAMVEAASNRANVSNGTTTRERVKIPDGTLVDIEASFAVSSADVKAGDAISFRVVSPVKVEGLTIIAAGALATGRVVKAKRAKSWGRAGQLAWRMETVAAVDEQLIPLQAMSGTRGESHAGEVATKTVVMGILLAPLFPIAPLALMHGYKKGENAVIPPGKRYTCFVQGNPTVNISIER